MGLGRRYSLISGTLMEPPRLQADWATLSPRQDLCALELGTRE